MRTGRFFWRALGVPSTMMDLMLWVNPHWHVGRQQLLVASYLEGDASAFAKVRFLVSFFLSWTKFSATRWAGVGHCCRKVVASQALGLDAMFKVVIADEGVQPYYTNGYKKATPEARLFVAVAAIAFYPAETVAIEILEDDRLILRQEELRLAMTEEMRYVSELPASTFEFIAEAACVGISASDFRTRVLRSMHVAGAYINRDVFSELDALPWSLLKGNIYDNVANIASMGAKPSEDTSSQIWESLHRGFFL